ncbi:DUF192 domain-containing protein [Natronolimnobius baerhuensis]|uniref:DUF192 domain-containing protein n=1 Tax=Natronolimnobius baerhuensis TaxID=253108 RepID=UPI000B404D89|nr:DUF192 domain-containing protein [Natronolimnobius baerhuensis]
MSLERTRRDLLGVFGTSSAVALAGCQTGDDEPTNTDSSATDEADTTVTTAGDGDDKRNDDNEQDTERTEDTANGGGDTADDDTDTAEDEDTETSVHADYETTEIQVVGPNGTERGSVTAALADTPALRYLGLSDTDDLPTDRGMLFVYDSVADRTFVMRDMDFGIDIIYADAEGTITDIHHAPAPEPDEDGETQRYPGRGQYVLEVGLEWTVERGVREGDVLEFDLEASE